MNININKNNNNINNNIIYINDNINIVNNNINKCEVMGRVRSCSEIVLMSISEVNEKNLIYFP